MSMDSSSSATDYMLSMSRSDNDQELDDVEERVFGPSFGLIGYSKGSTFKVNQLSLNLLISACVIVLSVAIIFLLGVNIVIQYRTIVLGDHIGMLQKVSYIFLSFLSIAVLHGFNVWFCKRMLYNYRNHKYTRLVTHESYELADHLK